MKLHIINRFVSWIDEYSDYQFTYSIIDDIEQVGESLAYNSNLSKQQQSFVINILKKLVQFAEHTQLFDISLALINIAELLRYEWQIEIPWIPNTEDPWIPEELKSIL